VRMTCGRCSFGSVGVQSAVKRGTDDFEHLLSSTLQRVTPERYLFGFENHTHRGILTAGSFARYGTGQGALDIPLALDMIGFN
jgi:hypothetical protein